jgi:DNA-binding NtrC family response regulator
MISPVQYTKKPGRKVVLLVEDEAELRNLFALMLEAQGLEVLQAGGGKEAMHLLSDRGNWIDIVVTDMNLPGGDGTMVISHARRVAPAVKILAMSGYGGADMRQAAAEAGADEFLDKPFSPPRAVDTVRRLLEQP